MPGPPRKPHRLRVVEGSTSKGRPMVPDLPAPASPLELPPGLSQDEKKTWQEHAKWLRDLGLESRVDTGSFLAMIRAFCRAKEADALVASLGLTVETESKNGHMIRPRPEVAISKDSWRAYSLLAQQFGMTPAARAKLGATPDKPKRSKDVPEPPNAAPKLPGA